MPKDPNEPTPWDYVTACLLTLLMGGAAVWLFVEFMQWLATRGL